MVKRIFSLIFMAVILSLLIWLLLQAAKEETLPIGSHLPVMEYTGISGMQNLNDSGRQIIIVYFSKACEHCRYQLQVFDEHIPEFNETSIYFFTANFLALFK